MTDFLSRLVDRVLGHAPVAQPLIAPHFAQGAEVFAPDATPFAVTESESYGHGDQTVSSAISSVAPDDEQATGQKREMAEPFSIEKKELPGISEDAAREVEFSIQPTRIRSTTIPRSDIEETLTLPPRPDRTQKEEARSSTRTISPPAASPVIEQKTQQANRIEARNPSVSIESSRSEKDIKSEVNPAGEMRKDMHQSAKEQTPLSSMKNSIELDNKPIEKQVSPALNAVGDVRQIERQSPAPRHYARIADQNTSDRQETPARVSASASAERVHPVPALPVEYDSSAERIVRPERITARGRADSLARATTPDKEPGAQSPQTIKVTIGRIEVRAVLPPAPRAQEATRPRPAMSLDDYLKSVSGERR